jgi:hypothetical protein
MSWILVALAVVVIGGGVAYYEHRQNTLVELDVGSHSVVIQKN